MQVTSSTIQIPVQPDKISLGGARKDQTVDRVFFAAALV